MSQVTFTVYTKPQSQGSIKSFQHPSTGRIVSMSTNKHLKPYRKEMARVATAAVLAAGLELPMAAKHQPVEITLEFMLLRPKSVPKKRHWPVVPADCDKFLRAALDSFDGVLYFDDAQVVKVNMQKVYGPVEQVHVSARVITEGTPF